MKAIQIKYLPPTNNKGTRLKVFAEGVKALTVSRDYSLDYRDQARILANIYTDSLGWGRVKGFGQLKNGDYVATLGD